MTLQLTLSKYAHIHTHTHTHIHIQYAFFDFLINMLGFSLPFSVCLWENLPAAGVAVLGFVPPVIATITAIFYIFW